MILLNYTRIQTPGNSGKTEHNDGSTTARATQSGVQKVNLTNKSRHYNVTLYIEGEVIMTAFSRAL